MNYLPRQAAIIAQNPSEADFAESAITSNGFQVRRFESTHSLVRQLQAATNSSSNGADTPDVAILVGSTSELTASCDGSIGQLARVMPVVVTTATATVRSAVELMKHGARDVVELPCDRDELWNRIRTALQQPPTDSTCVPQSAELQARFDLLTPAEHDVVDAMLDGLSNKQIAQRLGIGLRTVELRRSKIMKKMQARSVAELVKFICMTGKLHSQPHQADA